MGLFSRPRPIRLLTDIHSHLIPGIDDGVNSVEEAIEILKFLSSSGYQKVITTPHIRSDKYPNTIPIIEEGVAVVRERLIELGIDIQLEAAGEYFIDETFLLQIMSKGRMLSFGPNYLLIETSFYHKPVNIEQIIFEIRSSGYQPILAHPERYQYLEEDISWLRHVKAMGVLFQVTLTSLVGYYGAVPKKIARLLIDEGMVDILGTDIHRPAQMALNEEALKDKYILKAASRGLLNQKLV